MKEESQGDISSKNHTHCQTDRQKQEITDSQDIFARMNRIKHIILVLSGKGGVGKSTVAVNLAVTLAEAGKKVGLLDIDIHGPSIPQMLNLTKERLNITGEVLIPANYSQNLKVVSMGLLMGGRDEAVIWRGPLKMKIIKQFLKDADWGELDYLIIDSPPGTGDEPLSIAQLLPHADGAVIVTTPQEISVADVRRCINFCRKLSLKTLGVIENMSGFICPTCNTKIDIFQSGGGRKMSEEMGVPFLGSIPLDKGLVDACDSGKPYVQQFAGTETAKAFSEIIAQLTSAKTENTDISKDKSNEMKGDSQTMRIALPIANNKLCAHFGHCESFALIDVDEQNKTIEHSALIPSPGHQPGLLPPWLREHGVDLVITGGMGMKAIDLLSAQGIKVVMGASEDSPERLVQSYLEGSLVIGENICDHGEHICGHDEHSCDH
ncbi:P-loop NTPase [bacterium]|nr:P-loop NTPase [bacterium]